MSHIFTQPIGNFLVVAGFSYDDVSGFTFFETATVVVKIKGGGGVDCRGREGFFDGEAHFEASEGHGEVEVF